MRNPALMSALVVVSLAATVSGNDRGPLRVVAEGPLNAFDAELLATFAKARNRPMQPVTGTAAAVAAGSADVATGLYADAVTTADLATTMEVFPSRLVVVTRRPNARAAAIEALRWSRIGVLRGSRAPAAVHDSKISGAEVSEHPNLLAALSALRAGTVASLVVELPEALLAQHDDAQLELGAFLGTRRSCVYAVRSRDRAFLAGLNAFLQSLRSTPSWTAIVARHYGPAAFEVLARAHLGD